MQRILQVEVHGEKDSDKGFQSVITTHW